MMKRIVSFCGVLIIVTAFLFLFLMEDGKMFFLQVLAAVGTILLFPKCKEKYQVTSVFFLSVWVAAIDFVFVLLFMLHPESTFLGSGTSLMLQFGIPFCAAMLARANHFRS